MSKAQGNNTDIKDTDYSDTDPILSSDFSGRDVEKDEEFQSYYQYFYEELEMDYLFREFPYDKEVLESILEILVETVCSKRKLIRIASDDKPSEVVRSRLMKLNSEHIRYVLNCFKENTTKIRNPKQYLSKSHFCIIDSRSNVQLVIVQVAGGAERRNAEDCGDIAAAYPLPAVCQPFLLGEVFGADQHLGFLPYVLRHPQPLLSRWR